jgi:hypothetical protein
MLGQNENGDQGKQLNTKPSTDKWDTSGCSNVSGRQEEGLLNVGLNQASERQANKMPVQRMSPIMLSSRAAKRLAMFFKRGHIEVGPGTG